mmetsp:Transcript_19191/g.73427  ORF Transcript_19191/g.73427 Transcript_19191/m.73427 type:complete len:271 (+) Transcript_19191:217-1029(+)
MSQRMRDHPKPPKPYQTTGRQSRAHLNPRLAPSAPSTTDVSSSVCTGLPIRSAAPSASIACRVAESTSPVTTTTGTASSHDHAPASGSSLPPLPPPGTPPLSTAPAAWIRPCSLETHLASSADHESCRMSDHTSFSTPAAPSRGMRLSTISRAGRATSDPATADCARRPSLTNRCMRSRPSAKSSTDAPSRLRTSLPIRDRVEASSSQTYTTLPRSGFASRPAAAAADAAPAVDRDTAEWVEALDGLASPPRFRRAARRAERSALDRCDR